MQAWENDPSEPRANRLSMISGMLNVSLPWLLHGIGDAPPDDPRNDAISIIRGQFEKLRRLHEETGATITRIEDEILRLQRRREM